MSDPLMGQSGPDDPMFDPPVLDPDMRAGRAPRGTTEDVMIDSIAAAFHDAYERLAPALGYETRPESRKPWEEVPEDNKRLMRAVVRRLWDLHFIEPGRRA